MNDATVGTLVGIAPVAGPILVLALAVLFTRLWVSDTSAQAVRQLQVLGMRPGRQYKLGGAWTRAAVRDPRNVLWAGLALVAWVALIVSLDLARR